MLIKYFGEFYHSLVLAEDLWQHTLAALFTTTQTHTYIHTHTEAIVIYEDCVKVLKKFQKLSHRHILMTLRKSCLLWSLS